MYNSNGLLTKLEARGGSNNETFRDFYNKTEVSVLGFCLIYKEDNEIKRKYYNFISENLSHDSFFVKNAIKWLLEKNELFDFWNLSFWSDCGNHFRSKELIYFAVKEIIEQKVCWEIEINFFVEYHGKNDVDGNFGVISRWFKEGENVQQIENIDDLISYLNDKSKRSISSKPNNNSSEYQFFKFCPGKRDSEIKKIVVDNFKSYLSYRDYLGDTSYSLITNEDKNRYKKLDVQFDSEKDTQATRRAMKKKKFKVMGALARSKTEKRYAAMMT